MAYNSADEILAVGRISFEDFPQSEIELSIDEAEAEINLRIIPISEGDRGYDRYSRRLPLIKRAHAYLTLSYVLGRLPYEQLAHGITGDPISIGGEFSQGAVTPEKNIQADFYIRLSQEYRDKAEDLIHKAQYRIPRIH